MNSARQNQNGKSGWGGKGYLTKFEEYELNLGDKALLDELDIPIPVEEVKRLAVLRQTELIANLATLDVKFDRVAALASRLFKVPFAAISLVDVNKVWYKSRIGFSQISSMRYESFDSYTILRNSPDVYVILDSEDKSNDCKLKPLYIDDKKIRFYAGVAIMLENVKIGTLSIMDTLPHSSFDLKNQMNLLDLGAACIVTSQEIRFSAMNLNAERTKLVINMMHSLRTPMTSLSLATSMILDSYGIAPYSITSPENNVDSKNDDIRNGYPNNNKIDMTDNNSVILGSKGSNYKSALDNPAFMEINKSLNRLNGLVDSSLALGHAIMKCNTIEDDFVCCNLVEYLNTCFSMFSQNASMVFEWNINTEYLDLGKHFTYPDSLLLILTSSIGHLGNSINNMKINFSFQKTSKEDLEYPELNSLLMEGVIFLEVILSESNLGHNNDTVHASNKPHEIYNFLSINKVLSSIEGGCRLNVPTTIVNEQKSEFWIPCLILLETDETVHDINIQKQSKFIQLTSLTTYGENGDISVGKSMMFTDKLDNLQAVMTKIDKTKMIRKLKEGISKKTFGVKSKSFKELTNSNSIGLNVLVVDDSPVICKFMSNWIQTIDNCTVSVALNGKLGLELLKSNKFDVVFMDFLMPVQSGNQTFHSYNDWLSTTHTINNVVLVGMTALLSAENDINDAFRCGMHFVGMKPFNRLKLLDFLQAIIDQKTNNPSSIIENLVERLKVKLTTATSNTGEYLIDVEDIDEKNEKNDVTLPEFMDEKIWRNYCEQIAKVKTNDTQLYPK
eukprot:gene6648-9125_t